MTPISERVTAGVAKICRRCLRTKPLDQFWRNRAHPDGHCSWCKDCMHKHRGENVMSHGYAGYTAGCRCATCREAKRVYMAERRAAAIRNTSTEPVPGVTHGTRFAFEERGCRCPECVRAQADPERRHRCRGRVA